MLKSVTILCCLTAMTSPTNAAEDSKHLVQQFHELAFSKRQPAKAAMLYLGPTYIQHNPRVPDGPGAFVRFFETYLTQNPTSSSEIKRIIGDGDLVALHSHSRRSDDDRGTAIVDIFRVENDKIVEHWDVMQPVPETTVGGRSVF
jgi:predicted SnoaL-like aldol condensation-catalyzing enzyme